MQMKTMWSPTSRNTVQRDMEIQDIVSLHAFQNPGKALRSQLVLTQLARFAHNCKIALQTPNWLS